MPVLPKTATVSRLDLREVSRQERASQMLTWFDSLAPGERLIVTDADVPSDLLPALQKERKGLFEWSPVELRPGLAEVEVARREAPKGALRGVNEALSWDHDRLDALETGAFEARAAGAFAEARSLYGRFVLGLSRHIRFEEEVLFPAFEERTGMPPTMGPTAVMRFEHREIKAHLATIASLIEEPGSPAEASREQLFAVLGEHNRKEELMLYPTTDQVLSPDEADALVARIQRNA